VKEAEERAKWWKESQENAGSQQEGRTVSGIMWSSGLGVAKRARPREGPLGARLETDSGQPCSP